jgi:two-component system phosphate regulon response regulator PhoB/two-component system alkaline phosphatase synthesis response regulator PhoP
MLARILVVDDDPSILTLVAEALVDEGYEVAIARNGAEALTRLAEVVPAVLVTDLMMPIMDGPTLVRACRSKATTAALPIVVMSAALSAVLDDPAPLGVQEMLEKPFDIHAFLAAVDRLVVGTEPVPRA